MMTETKTEVKTPKLDTKRLKELAEHNPTSKIVLAFLARRDRSRAVTDLGRLYNMLKDLKAPVKMPDVIETFEWLQDMQLGTLIQPRKSGEYVKFQWGKIPLRSVALGSMTLKEANAVAAQFYKENVVDRRAPGLRIAIRTSSGNTIEVEASSASQVAEIVQRLTAKGA